MFWKDDWTTEGDWVGRYGYDFAVLCAMNSPLNQTHARVPYYHVTGAIGPHNKDNDSLRHWVHWKKTDRITSLYSPAVGYRRQAEWDDHGEVYPRSFEGPDLLIHVKCEAGFHKVSFYLVNKDGHAGECRIRDFLITGTLDGSTLLQQPVPLRGKGEMRARVRDFWGGVYKSFVVEGPGTWTFKIAKGDSLDTLCSAVLIDRLSGPATVFDRAVYNYPNTLLHRDFGSSDYSLAAPLTPPTVTGKLIPAQRSLWAEWLLKGDERLQTIRHDRPIADESTRAVLSRRLVNLWTLADRIEFRDTVHQGWIDWQERIAKQAALMRATTQPRRSANRETSAAKPKD